MNLGIDGWTAEKKGREEEIETALEMLSDGVKHEKIARYVKRSVQWVENLLTKV
ncbi:MAG: hypothetical protein FWG65_07700 [Turicibacter sp.]|nr:hypothetical protein [Turicibacter sp.]